MKTYQDPDPLHGNGKAVPKPKQPRKTTPHHVANRYRGKQIVGAVKISRKG